MVYRFVFLFTLLTVTTAHAQHHPMHAATAMVSPFNRMMDSMMVCMDTVPASPSADQYFLALMLPHHQGAVDMATYEISHGRNTQLVQMAKSIRAEQQIDMQWMNRWLRDLTHVQTSDPDHVRLQGQAMMTMMKQLPPAGLLRDTDQAFARLMVPHHQAAVVMAQIVIRYGQDPAVRRYAERLISAEQIEIDQLHEFIDSRKNQAKQVK
ncbi:uncharacterized protein (DUF305 family) [Spirosoma oryzae]|uniref:Uncharacterized protein (DUF305 family) n=1 Tax=Spirosoma oryzae TaxID=1469603 RepID=A0A2T0SNI2_9BACT|nr:DUF305 domain-containing protein [Spirosoma oryzae]PRY34974.1 uncharacterized protein (DUF305 family) [Spirosoma oryzae]